MQDTFESCFVMLFEDRSMNWLIWSADVVAWSVQIGHIACIPIICRSDKTTDSVQAIKVLPRNSQAGPPQARIYYKKVTTMANVSVLRLQTSQISHHRPSLSSMSTESCFLSMPNLPLEERTIVSRFGRGLTIPITFSSIHEAFENIAENHASAVAARFAGRTLTYLQLDAAANRLAHCLILAGLKPRERVCLVVQRSFEMLVGILAVLKAGCQYVPIDGGVASEQAFLHIFTDTNARFLLCLPHFYKKIRRMARKDAVVFSLTMDIGAFYPATKPSVQVSPNDGAYAIYTSGKLLFRAKLPRIYRQHRKYRQAERS
jgi:non-ribosomal peptide synthetase component F